MEPDKKNNQNILYVISGVTGFKQTDETLFAQISHLKKVNIIKLKDYLSFKNIRYFWWCDSVVIWFASFHALPFILLNMIFKKRIIIIAGGYDVVDFPGINYGSMRYGFRRTIGKWILKNAHSVIAVSESNKEEIIQNCGVEHHRIKLIYNAIDLNKDEMNFSKLNQILTVGEINEETILRKGLDRFIQVAKYFPETQFIHIGKWTDKHGKTSEVAFNKLKVNAPNNVKFMGFVSKDTLEKLYKESKIYLQLSRHEAFGVSVVEAMKYECVPIVSNAFALPEIVGNNGFIIKNKFECISAIKTVLTGNYSIQNNINPLFDISKRKAAFERLLSQ